MIHGTRGRSLREQLANPEGSIWLTIAGDILPKVRRELRRRFGIERRWISPEDAVLSACRTFFRRLQGGQAASYPLDTLDDLEALLFVVAHRKLVSAIRVNDRESRHAPRVMGARREAVEEPDEISVFLIDLLDQLLETDYERAIFREKMKGTRERLIAEILHRADGVPWSRYMVREAWRRFRKRARRRIAEVVEAMEN
jgi:hypothetical protein